jgi:hypothetical protein
VLYQRRTITYVELVLRKCHAAVRKSVDTDRALAVATALILVLRLEARPEDGSIVRPWIVGEQALAVGLGKKESKNCNQHAWREDHGVLVFIGQMDMKKTSIDCAGCEVPGSGDGKGKYLPEPSVCHTSHLVQD